MNYTDIRFPHLGIVLNHVGKYIEIGNFQIMFYGIVIAIGFLLGLFVAQQEAKRSGQDPEIYLDYFIYMIIPSILGARLYYVIFSWDFYKQYPLEIINLRHGGLGIVGGVAMAIFVLYLFCKKKNYSMLLMLDTLCMGLLVGQILGRWGNFFNREAFGGFTDGPLAMQIPVPFFEQFGRMGEIQATGLLEHVVNNEVNGQMISYIQVHPTFLYEGLWNLMILLILFFYRKNKKYDGDMICIYFIGYGIGRFLIEGLRVDQLTIGSTGIAATQVVCVLLVIGGLIGMIRPRIRHLAKSDEL